MWIHGWDYSVLGQVVTIQMRYIYVKCIFQCIAHERLQSDLVTNTPTITVHDNSLDGSNVACSADLYACNDNSDISWILL